VVSSALRLRAPGSPPGPLTARAAKHVRRVLGQRVRALRKQRALSQQRLGKESGLSRKFIGDVERGERSISFDNLYHVAVTLGVPLRDLTDIGNHYTVPTEDAEAIFALVSRRRPETVRKAYNVLRAMFSEAERTLTPR
jgi:transcriptional regulator with XRE-family HTH domain